MMFHFADPYFLGFILVIPFLVFFRSRYGKAPEIKVSSLSGTHWDQPFFPVFAIKCLSCLKYAALVFLIVALARPQWGEKKRMVVTRGINIVLALDLSESMAAFDFKLDKQIVTRLDAVKAVVSRFITKREGDRIGMVVFGSKAYTQIPLTRDYNTIAFLLDNLEIGAAGPSTAVGDAIGISLKRLEDIESKSNIIILLTDGKSNSGSLSPQAAAEIAAQRGVRIYTIGVGKTGRAPFLVKDPLFGERYVYQRVETDLESLEHIADITGGEFFTAGDTQTLDKIYKIIDRMEKTEVKVKEWADYRDLFVWFVLPGFVLLCLYVVLSNTRFLRVP